VVFRAQPSIANFGAKIVSIHWGSIVLSCAEIIFHRTRLFSEIQASSLATAILGNIRTLFYRTLR